MRRDEVEAILAMKEREMGLAGRRRPHLHPCTQGCGVPEPCEDRTCTYPPSDKSLICTRTFLAPCVWCKERRRMGVIHLCPTAFAEAEKRVIGGTLP